MRSLAKTGYRDNLRNICEIFAKYLLDTASTLWQYPAVRISVCRRTRKKWLDFSCVNIELTGPVLKICTISQMAFAGQAYSSVNSRFVLGLVPQWNNRAQRGQRQTK